MILIRFVQWCE